MGTENTSPDTAAAFSRLYELAQTLRGREGCPWDKDQTPQSMRRDLMEETFEAIDAITQHDAPHVKEELGDVLFNAVLIAYMYEQQGDFTVAGVLDDVCGKLIRRHPHVFDENSRTGSGAMSVDAVLSQWDVIKGSVEGRARESVLDEVPEGFPPLLKAYKYLGKAAKLHFDWNCAEDAMAKVTEELSEVKDAADDVRRALEAHPVTGRDGRQAAPLTVTAENPAADDCQLHLEEEIGDLLLSIVNVSRKYNVDPAIALDRANRKFHSRFSFVEKCMKEEGIPFAEDHLVDMERFWKDAKNAEKNAPSVLI